jgi:hypothetical protein
MISLSWRAQAMNRQERIEEPKPQVIAHLRRHSALRVCGVNARDALDDDRPEPSG